MNQETALKNFTNGLSNSNMVNLTTTTEASERQNIDYRALRELHVEANVESVVQNDRSSQRASPRYMIIKTGIQNEIHSDHQ